MKDMSKEQLQSAPSMRIVVDESAISTQMGKRTES